VQEWRGVQGGVPQAAPRQFPECTPEAIERFENAKRLKEKERSNNEFQRANGKTRNEIHPNTRSD